VGLNKNYVADAKGGNPRVISPNAGCIKTACSTGAKHVQIKLPTKHIRIGEELYEIDNKIISEYYRHLTHRN